MQNHVVVGAGGSGRRVREGPAVLGGADRAGRNSVHVAVVKRRVGDRRARNFHVGSFQIAVDGVGCGNDAGGTDVDLESADFEAAALLTATDLASAGRSVAAVGGELRSAGEEDAGRGAFLERAVNDAPAGREEIEGRRSSSVIIIDWSP